mgnify:CR=1 FL=1
MAVLTIAPGTMYDWKSLDVQSFGIKFERIDRDLLWVYVTAVRRIYI